MNRNSIDWLRIEWCCDHCRELVAGHRPLWHDDHMLLASRCNDNFLADADVWWHINQHQRITGVGVVRRVVSVVKRWSIIKHFLKKVVFSKNYVNEKMSEEEGESLSAYELERLQNIERNKAQLRALGLIDDNGENPLNLNKPKKKKKKQKYDDFDFEPKQPQRASARLLRQEPEFNKEDADFCADELERVDYGRKRPLTNTFSRFMERQSLSEDLKKYVGRFKKTLRLLKSKLDEYATLISTHDSTKVPDFNVLEEIMRLPFFCRQSYNGGRDVLFQKTNFSQLSRDIVKTRSDLLTCHDINRTRLSSLLSSTSNDNKEKEAALSTIRDILRIDDDDDDIRNALIPAGCMKIVIQTVSSFPYAKQVLLLLKTVDFKYTDNSSLFLALDNYLKDAKYSDGSTHAFDEFPCFFKSCLDKWRSERLTAASPAVSPPGDEYVSPPGDEYDLLNLLSSQLPLPLPQTQPPQTQPPQTQLPQTQQLATLAAPYSTSKKEKGQCKKCGKWLVIRQDRDTGVIRLNGHQCVD